MILYQSKSSFWNERSRSRISKNSCSPPPSRAYVWISYCLVENKRLCSNLTTIIFSGLHTISQSPRTANEKPQARHSTARAPLSTNSIALQFIRRKQNKQCRHNNTNEISRCETRRLPACKVRSDLSPVNWNWQSRHNNWVHRRPCLPRADSHPTNTIARNEPI